MSFHSKPEAITYGVSYSKLHADELGLNWKEAYQAILNDLRVMHLRLSAHWPMIEPEVGQFHFEEMDYQMNEARVRGADVILAVGLRIPGWPECHTPSWLLNETTQKIRERQLLYIEAVVERYKGYSNLKYWQVENEAFLNFATQYCGKGDEEFLQKEIALVRSLDPTHKIMVTDSGEFGKWYKAWRNGDVFGTSVYLYIWHHIWGPLRYPIGPGFFGFKLNVMEWFFKEKPSLLSELGAEPWLTSPIRDAAIEAQLERMDINKFNEVIAFGKKTPFDTQYLWGAEWWYYMTQNNHPEFWTRARELYSSGK